MTMEFTEKDLYLCEYLLVENPEINSDYWIRRINQRLNFLNPLIHELTLKGINLIDISKDLNYEYNTLLMIKAKYL